MTNEILILTLLPEKGTTGVQSHFNSFSAYLDKINVDNKIITPYTYGQSFLFRLVGKLTPIINKFDQEQAIIFSREHRIEGLRNNLLKHIKKNTKSYYIYAQDPSTALMAIELKNKHKNINFVKINFICHFNVSEINEYVMSQKVSDQGKLSKYLHRKEEEAFKTADKIIFPSNFLQAIVLKRIVKSSIHSNTAVINNFVEDSLTISKLDDSQTDFLSIGTLESRKNQEFSIRIISELHKLGYKKRLIIVGNGPDRVDLEKLTQHLNIVDYVIFTGYINNAKALLLNTKFLLHTAKIENFPITLLEALSYGIPICAAPVGGIPEIFQDTKEGVYLELKDPKKSAEKISVLFDEKAYAEVSKNARKRYENKFNTEHVAALLLNAILGDQV